VDTKELEKIKRESEAARLSLSDYVRSLMFSRRIRQPRTTKQDSMNIVALNRIGGLVKNYHSSSGAENAELTAELLTELRQTVRTINGLIAAREKE
jgi:hypothetical protein